MASVVAGNEYVERNIAMGLIVSSEYAAEASRVLRLELFDSPELRAIARWALDYYQKYKSAPGRAIQDIFLENSKKLSKAESSYIAEILESLSDEYERGGQFNYEYLLDKTVHYLKSQELDRHQRKVKALIDEGRVDEAEALARSFQPTVFDRQEIGIELSKSEQAAAAIDRAFSRVYSPVLSYPGALGELMNEHLTRGSLVSILAPEKRGKSFFLLDAAMRAVRQKANVAYFEAGDMTEDQVLRRICIYISKRSDNERYCSERFRPVPDCVFNQIDRCDRRDRECDHGVFKADLKEFTQNMSRYLKLENLIAAFEKDPTYSPCTSKACPHYRGSVWLERVRPVRPLTAEAAKLEVERFFSRYKRRFKLSCHPSGTLTVIEIKRILELWERQDGFIPDLIVIDYADLLSASDSRIGEFRHQQDHIWKSLRALSQERHVLVLTATQADAQSYSRDRLTMLNFSEDKRKLAHVTAQFGLNQDPNGNEKKLGVMRVNAIVVREGDSTPQDEVMVLQDLPAGRAVTASFWWTFGSPSRAISSNGAKPDE